MSEPATFDPNRWRDINAAAFDTAAAGRMTYDQARLEGILAALLEWARPDPDLVSLLPKGTGRDPKSSCNQCGGFHKAGMFHLDYLGHADLTMVLGSIDPMWRWDPVAVDDHGFPMFDRDGRGNPVGLWINLTVGATPDHPGHSRQGYGTCDPNKADAEKILIGDALRNAAMRFGVGTALWSKADKADTGAGRESAPERRSPSRQASTPANRPDGAGGRPAASVSPWKAALAEEGNESEADDRQKLGAAYFEAVEDPNVGDLVVDELGDAAIEDRLEFARRDIDDLTTVAGKAVKLRLQAIEAFKEGEASAEGY